MDVANAHHDGHVLVSWEALRRVKIKNRHVSGSKRSWRPYARVCRREGQSKESARAERKETRQEQKGSADKMSCARE